MLVMVDWAWAGPAQSSRAPAQAPNIEVGEFILEVQWRSFLRFIFVLIRVWLIAGRSYLGRPNQNIPESGDNGFASSGLGRLRTV